MSLNKELKALNIRDYQDSPLNRSDMGHFKHQAYQQGKQQADLFAELMEFAYRNGFFEPLKKEGK